MPNPSFEPFCNGSITTPKVHIGHMMFEMNKGKMPPGDLGDRCEEECAADQSCTGYTVDGNKNTASCKLLFSTEQGCMASCQRNKYDHQDLPTKCEDSCKTGTKGVLSGTCEDADEVDTFTKGIELLFSFLYLRYG